MASRRATERQSGFSLLEMVIALAIMGMLGALAMPSLQKVTERTGFSLDLQDVERQLDQLPQIAASQGKALVLTSSTKTVNYENYTPETTTQAPYPVKLPEGWEITVDAPISYRYDGTCSGGKLHLTTPASHSDYLMKPPLCELRPG